MLDRRRFLQALAAAGVSPVLPACAQVATPRFAHDPFALGVASGYPHPGGMVLWTRLVGIDGPVAVPVRWVRGTPEIARAFGDVSAVPTLHVFDRGGRAAGSFFGAPPDLHARAGSLIDALLE